MSQISKKTSLLNSNLNWEDERQEKVRERMMLIGGKDQNSESTSRLTLCHFWEYVVHLVTPVRN